MAARSSETGSVRTGLWTWDIPADRIYLDAASAEFFNVDPYLGERGICGDVCVQAVHPLDRQRVHGSIMRAVETGGGHEECFRLTRAGTDRIVLADGRCFRDATDRPILYSGRISDITGLVRGNDEVADAMTNLRRLLVFSRSSRLPTLTYLLSMAEHELADRSLETKARVFQ